MKKKRLAYVILIIGILCIVVAIALSAFHVFDKDDSEKSSPKLTTTEMVNQAIELLANRSDYTEDDLIFSEINDDNDVVFNVKSEDGLSLVVDIKTGDYYFISMKNFDSTNDVLEDE